ncbi:5'/3'-nucleotidase SurE [uncultured Sphingomonas sp.]|uniref:5'/3'-nucleotidase SurE n=1 Tax=uncultured Sphingomonas sp. TaxID=158754 RepID=UPI0025D22BED|nr:5'/3'-nucleotidase SurE [uncultured Sphingomonas sp.]
MRILVTNDDGIGAAGIHLLEEVARGFSEDVTVVAPAEEQSGKGRSLTISQPMRLRTFDDRHHAVTGTPTDAVIAALALIMKDNPPDLILSGINRGSNLAEDVSYSGTVAAAMEGALAGIPAIALSQVDARPGMGDTVPFSAAEAWARTALEPLIAGLGDWTPNTLVNINFPAIDPEAVKGIRVVRQGLRDYGDPQLEKSTDPRGYDYYWLNVGRVKHQSVATDLELSDRGYVTVTPLHLDMTHAASMARLESLYR